MQLNPLLSPIGSTSAKMILDASKEAQDTKNEFNATQVAPIAQILAP